MNGQQHTQWCKTDPSIGPCDCQEIDEVEEQDEEPCCEHCGEQDGMCDTCSYCDTCTSEGCECCSECGSSYCSGPCGTCDYCECECCPECEDSPCCCEAGYGSSMVPPWQVRGIDPIEFDTYSHRWQDVWAIDQSIDLATAAADFYLLEAVTANVVNGSGASAHDRFCTVLRSEARDMLSSHVARLDATFQAYVDMVVGGELRYHKCLSGGSADRSDAWLQWKGVRQSVGSQALLDASDLFIEMRDDTSAYGGSPWAQAAQILHARETGRISAHIFVDRVFNAQHNGGSLLNKVEWSVTNRRKWYVHRGMNRVLNAHAADECDFATLLSVASTEVRGLVLDYWQACNWANRLDMVPPVPKPDWGAEERAERRALIESESRETTQMIAAAAACLLAAGTPIGKSYYKTAVQYPTWWGQAISPTVEYLFRNVTAERFYAMANYGATAPWLLPVGTPTVLPKGHPFQPCSCATCGGTCLKCGGDAAAHALVPLVAVAA